MSLNIALVAVQKWIRRVNKPMKRGIEVHSDYDRSGRWCLIIKKKKGKLSLDEIKECAREYELDYYLLVLDCIHDEDNDDNPYCELSKGDMVILYRTDLLYEEGE